MVTAKERSSTFLRKKVHPGDVAGGLSDLELTWLLDSSDAATGAVLMIRRWLMLIAV